MIEYSFDAKLVGEWVVEKAGGTYTGINTAIGILKDNKLIAGVMYEGFTGKEGSEGGTVFIHSRIDEPSKVTRQFYFMIFDYPFNQLKIKVLRGIVDKNNLCAIRLNEHINFKRECELRDYFLNSDAIVYAMRKDDCRFLRGKYVQSIKNIL